MTPSPEPHRRASRWLRRLVGPLAGGGVLAAALAVAPLGPSPAGAVNLGWSLTVQVPATVAEPTVTVSGRAGVLLGQARTVQVRLVPRAALPAACGTPEGTGPVTGGAYSVELRPACNGPYRAEVVATGTDLLGRTINSGSPARRDVALADPGPAPASPGAQAGPDGITLTWSAASDPDVVGWTLLREGGSPQDHPVGTTRAVVPAPVGDHGFRLVSRRWGVEGPDGAEVASPASPLASVQVAPTPLDPPTRPEGTNGSGGGAPGPGAGDGGSAGTEGTGPAASGAPGRAGGADVSAAGVPRRRGGPLPRGVPDRGASSAPRGTAPAGDPGYGDELPYGDRAGAAEADPADELEPAGEQVAASLTPRVVRSTERTSPGLVVPFTVAFLLGSVAVWLWAYLRRARSAAALAEADLGGEDWSRT